MNSTIPIIIPSYEPDERLCTLLKSLKVVLKNPIIIVNDGSSREYDKFFDEAKEILGEQGIILKHEVNKGKGQALKTAFSYVSENMPSVVGAVTADSDGQHSPECIRKVIDALDENPSSLIMGVRDFDKKNVPKKSRFGNKLTSKVLASASGVKVSDTQTGLRGIPMAFLKELINVKGNRFEFETVMLLESAKKYPIAEVPIETIYDSKENHQTHFNPFKDSIRIYAIILKRFLKFSICSLTSCAIDLIMFSIFCRIFKAHDIIGYVALATAIARVFSCAFNFTINYIVVFKSDETIIKSLIKYASIAIVQMALSAGLVSFFVAIIPHAIEVVVKMFVDTGLFFANYYVQHKFVFKKQGKPKETSSEQ